jgi:O-antigen/teichoic acid export membrane protein
MKQSTYLVVLQIISISLGLISVFWIASSLPAQVYAVTAIYTVINSLIIVFSNTGLETYAIRNILAWEQNNEYGKIKMILTQAIFLRIIVAFILVAPMIAYCYYISAYKFGGEYLSIFITMVFFGVISSINESMILILKSFNKYFSAALIVFVISVVGRILALILFIKFGFIIYIYTIILLPLATIIPVFIMLRKWINPKLLLNRQKLFINLKLSKSFTFSAYISYMFNYVDQLLVTIFLTPELISSFSVGKRIFLMAKQFIENVFDPQLQKLITVKNNIKELQIRFDKITKTKNILLIIGILTIPLIILSLNPIIKFIGLTQYPDLYYLVITIFLSQLLHLALKVKYNYISLFYPPDYYLKLTALKAILSLVFFILILYFFSFKYIFSFIILTNFIMLLYSGYVFKTNNGVNKFISVTK